MVFILIVKYMYNMKINVVVWCVVIFFYIFIFVVFLVWIGWKIFVFKMGIKCDIIIRGGY